MAANSLQKQPEQVGGGRASAARARRVGCPVARERLCNPDEKFT